MVALVSGERSPSAKSWIFVLDEPDFWRPLISVFPVSPRQGGDLYTTRAADLPAPSPPCQSWSAFFIKGIGDPPPNPVLLQRWRDGGPSRAISVEPARHTLSMRPVLRFSTRDVSELRDRKATFLMGITLAGGTKPFVLIGLARRPDGSWSEAVFVPRAEEQGWSAFVSGDVTDISFYALDDPQAAHSACRPRAGNDGPPSLADRERRSDR